MGTQLITTLALMLLLTGCSAERQVRRHCPCVTNDCANCDDFPSQRDAYRCHRATLQLYGYDYHRLDRDRDGIPCEPEEIRR